MGHRRQKHCQVLGYVDDRRVCPWPRQPITPASSSAVTCMEFKTIAMVSGRLALHCMALLSDNDLCDNKEMMAKEVVKKQMRRNVWS